MSLFQVNIVTKDFYEAESFICPNCLVDFGLNRYHEKIEKPMRFGGSTTSCFECGEMFLILDKGSIPSHNLMELENKQPILVYGETEFVESLMQ